jgi:anhydro-N-acetylmuramic acid kinase
MKQIYIGVMSGTSLDGIDAVALDLTAEPQLLATHYLPYNDLLRQRLRRLCQGCSDELSLYADLDSHLGQLFAETARSVIDKAGLTAGDIRAIGSHGQTVRHYPERKAPNSLQIGNPNIIAEMTGVTTIADFRRRDMAAGGQGAPLVPAFHRAVFSDATRIRAVINIGGIANITWLPATGQPDHFTHGFDTGPGNTLMDTWIQRHKQARFDENGHWAKQGKCNPDLLQALQSDPYFTTPAPKSTGCDYFNLIWLEKFLARHPDLPVNVQATLCELTASTIGAAVRACDPAPTQVFICGGGSHNAHLLERLAAHLPRITVDTTAVLGMEPDWVESTAFAWLAQQTLAHQSGNLPVVTGAAKEVILGCIYPA